MIIGFFSFNITHIHVIIVTHRRRRRRQLLSTGSHHLFIIIHGLTVNNQQRRPSSFDAKGIFLVAEPTRALPNPSLHHLFTSPISCSHNCLFLHNHHDDFLGKLHGGKLDCCFVGCHCSFGVTFFKFHVCRGVFTAVRIFIIMVVVFFASSSCIIHY